MAITRTPIVDDDGSGTTGTILNNAWKQEFYDQIDAIVAPPAGATNPLTIAGAQPTLILDDATNVGHGRLTVPAGTGELLLSTNLTLSGGNWMLDDVAKAGMVLHIEPVAGTMALYRGTPGANPRVLDARFYVTPVGGIHERGRAFPMGEWLQYPFNAANFWAGMTAGAQQFSNYTVIGKTLFWNFYMYGAPTPAGLTVLPITIPAGFGTVVTTAAILSYCYEASSNLTAGYLTAQPPNQVGLAKNNGTAWVSPVTAQFAATIQLG